MVTRYQDYGRICHKKGKKVVCICILLESVTKKKLIKFKYHSAAAMKWSLIYIYILQIIFKYSVKTLIFWLLFSRSDFMLQFGKPNPCFIEVNIIAKSRDKERREGGFASKLLHTSTWPKNCMVKTRRKIDFRKM